MEHRVKRDVKEGRWKTSPLSLSLSPLAHLVSKEASPKRRIIRIDKYTNSIKLGREPIIADPFNNSSAGENSIRLGIGGRTKEAE